MYSCDKMYYYFYFFIKVNKKEKGLSELVKLTFILSTKWKNGVCIVVYSKNI